jgi:hypothetical protein
MYGELLVTLQERKLISCRIESVVPYNILCHETVALARL